MAKRDCKIFSESCINCGRCSDLFLELIDEDQDSALREDMLEDELKEFLDSIFAKEVKN